MSCRGNDMDALFYIVFNVMLSLSFSLLISTKDIFIEPFGGGLVKYFGATKRQTENILRFDILLI